MDANSVLNKRFPTILGLMLLFGALGAGVFFIGTGPGIFSPRATPQTTPKNVKVSNLTDATFTISFITDEATAGFVKYGTSATSLTNRESDDRDQLSGNVGTYNTHHITVRNLQPNTNYFFTIGTGTAGQFDNNGKPYTVKTVTRNNNSTAQTIYGTVLTKESSPADGSIVYVTVDKGAEMSALVRSSGTWAIPLSQLRSVSGGAPPEINTNTLMLVFVQGKTPQETATLTTTVGQPQFPVKTITLGQENSPAATTAPTGTTISPTQAITAQSTTALAQPTRAPQATTTAQAGTNNKPTITASGSATPVATVTRPTNTPRPATPTPDDVSLPATDSQKPLSGSAENTMAVFVAGLLLISFGGILYLSIRK